MDFTHLVTKYSAQIYAHGASPELQKAFLDSLSPGQVFSKISIIEIFKKLNCKYNRALFVGQWHGMLPHMFFQEGLIKTGFGIELSERWSSISYNINSDWDWTSIQGDVNTATVWNGIQPDLVVNTSSEHMSFDWLEFVSPGTTVLLQSTNFEIPEHTHRVFSLNELIKKANFSSNIVSTENDYGIYKRFTLLGKK